jgi:preprotein translocase subunit SecF
LLDIVGKRYWYFLVSLLIILPGTFYLAVFRLHPGIEFDSGTSMTLTFERPPEQAALRSAMGDIGYGDSIIQHSGDNAYLIRTRALTEAQPGADQSGERDKILNALRERFGAVTLSDYYTVSPIIANEIVQKSALAVVVASVFILVYITWAFRRVPKPFRYGTCAIIALLHDVLVVLGIFAILGHHFNVEIDSLFITAVLTVIGFSVHDTIVVFDRIRENLRRGSFERFEDVVNHSLNQTLARSLNTSLTVVFTLTALLLFGGGTIHNFVLTLLIGIISGTFSSIFNASMLLVVWENGELGSLFRRLTGRRALPAT